MTAISSLGSTVASAAQGTAPAQKDDKLAQVAASAPTEDIGKATSSTDVRISETGRALSMNAGQPGGALATSGGDDASEATRKALEKQIKELQQQLQETQQELAKVQSDASLDERQKDAQRARLVGELGALNAALSTAQGLLLSIQQEALAAA